VTAKNIPVTMSAEERSIFYAFKGNLPDSLTGAARIKVKVHSKKCPANDGMLLIIK